MDSIQQNDARGVLNETSMTIHKHEMGVADFQTVCGQTYQVAHGQLRMVSVKQAIEAFGAAKCGACFEDGPGY